MYETGSEQHKIWEGAIMYCENCGTQLEEDTIFCPSCGVRKASAPASASIPPAPTPVSTPAPTQAPTQAPTPAPAKKAFPLAEILGVAVLILVILIILIPHAIEQDFLANWFEGYIESFGSMFVWVAGLFAKHSWLPGLSLIILAISVILSIFIIIFTSAPLNDVVTYDKPGFSKEVKKRWGYTAIGILITVLLMLVSFKSAFWLLISIVLSPICMILSIIEYVLPHKTEKDEADAKKTVLEGPGELKTLLMVVGLIFYGVFVWMFILFATMPSYLMSGL
jgi:hypothetical protein